MNTQYVQKHFLRWPQLIKEKALAIYVYGSVARNDNDENSDCDILVCVDDCSEAEYSQLKSSVQYVEKHYKYEFAFYQISTLKAMWQKGSYFLWHIKTEGILLYQKDNSVQLLLENLPQYQGTFDDLCEYSEILDDIRGSIEEDNVTFEYDLSILATLARNICIATCYMIGQMDFGRIGPVVKCTQLWKEDFPFSLSEYMELYEYRLVIARGKYVNTCPPTKAYMVFWYEKISYLLDLAFSLCQL